MCILRLRLRLRPVSRLVLSWPGLANGLVRLVLPRGDRRPSKRLSFINQLLPLRPRLPTPATREPRQARISSSTLFCSSLLSFLNCAAPALALVATSDHRSPRSFTSFLSSRPPSPPILPCDAAGEYLPSSYYVLINRRSLKLRARARPLPVFRAVDRETVPGQTI
jgi:hypothetical protein